MLNYIKIQNGFSMFDLLTYLYPGSYIYLESIENDKDEKKDYPVVWYGGFGDSSKSTRQDIQKYKVKIDFRGTLALLFQLKLPSLKNMINIKY